MELVNFETAKLIKEKWFKKDCNYHYYTSLLKYKASNTT